MSLRRCSRELAAKTKFGSNFKPRAQIGSEAKTTKNLAFGSLSNEDKANLRNKLAANSFNQKEEIKDISSVIPSTGYYIKKIARSYLKPAPDDWNFFSKPSKDDLLLLAESIYYNGLLQPIIVREMDNTGRTYQILAGHTRNEAYNILYEVLQEPKYLEIEAIIFPYGIIQDEQAQDIICDTNFMQRGNLPSREMAKCVFLKAKRLKENSSYGEGSIANKIAEEYKIKKTSVFMWKKLANLTDELQNIVDNRKITLKNAYKLAFLSHEDQLKLIDECSNYISNESLKTVKTSDSLSDMIQKIENNFGVQFKHVRYIVAETELNNVKDVPLLIYVSPSKKEEIINQINNIDGAYVVKD